MEEPLILDENELVEYIYNKLLAKGIAVKQSDIEEILGLEMDYMIENGFAFPAEEE
jgi:hypothetical protein